MGQRTAGSILSPRSSSLSRIVQRIETLPLLADLFLEPSRRQPVPVQQIELKLVVEKLLQLSVEQVDLLPETLHFIEQVEGDGEPRQVDLQVAVQA